MNQCHPNFHPYLNPVSYEDSKAFTRRRGGKKNQSSCLSREKKKVFSACNFTKTQNKKPCSSSKVGRYILTEVNPATCLCKALDVNSQVEYTCRVVDIRKHRDLTSLHCLVGSHRNINQIREVVLGDHLVYVIYEQSFSDLHSYVRSRKKLPEDEACRLFKQIVNVVAYCHEKGLLLRDLKLRKFVFKDRQRLELKLETLDGAYILNDKNCDTLHDKHGCPAYVSPEILDSSPPKGYSGKAAEVWSLGVILYTMLFGRYPFHDQEPSALFSRIRAGSFSIPDTVSPKAKCLLHAMLRKEPTERLSASELLDHPWFSSNFLVTPSHNLHWKGADQIVPDVLLHGEGPSFFS